MTTPNRSRPAGALRQALASRTVIADGAMGTMLQEADPTMDDFQGHEGCNEILNVSRPDIVRSVHDQYLAAGVDAIETNTFGANWANLAEYGIEDRIYELAYTGGVIAREAADAFSTPDKPRFVLGSLGPGTKLPSLGHTTYQHLRDAYEIASQGLVDSGADALLIETCRGVSALSTQLASASERQLAVIPDTVHRVYWGRRPGEFVESSDDAILEVTYFGENSSIRIFPAIDPCEKEIDGNRKMKQTINHFLMKKDIIPNEIED